MIKYLPLAVIAVICLAAALLWEPPIDDRYDVVHIHATIDEGYSAGTGIVVACDTNTITVLTAAHVIDFPDAIITLEGYPCTNGRELSRHPELDLALLLFDKLPRDPPLVVRRLYLAPVPFGSRVTLLGYANDSGPWLTEGFVSVPGHSTAAAYFGDSGGPISMTDGRVCGILTAVYPSTFAAIYHLTLFVPLADATEWLEENGIKR